MIRANESRRIAHFHQCNSPHSKITALNHMSKIIELPDPLFAEINGYAQRVSASPISVIWQAWDEFRNQHAQESVAPLQQAAATEDLLAMVSKLRGSISLPVNADDKTLITETRIEKYGPL